jgi:hypothetical protein
VNVILRNSYSLPNIKVTKARGMRWVEHVGQTEKVRNAHNIWYGNLNGSGHLGVMWVDGT